MIPAFLADRENRKRRGDFDHENRIGSGVGVVADWHDDFDADGDNDGDEIVLETKGSSPPPPPSPMEEARAQMELDRSRAEIAAQEQARKDALAAQERSARIDKARGLGNQAFNSAQSFGSQQVGARGFDQGLVDQYGLLDLFNSAVDRTRMGIAEDDLNPMASYNLNTMFNDALNTARGTYRGDLTRQFNEVAPEDFAFNTFQDTADDAILQDILGSRRNDALAQIDMAKSRGQLNDVGYARALSQLDQQGQSAMADLQDLGGGILSGYRDQLGALRDNQLTKINSADFNNPLNFDTFTNRLNQTTNDLNNRMAGDLFRATNGQSFFDPSTIISGSGAIQGFFNPTSGNTKQTAGVTNPLLDAFTNQETQKKNTGANGVF